MVACISIQWSFYGVTGLLQDGVVFVASGCKSNVVYDEL